MACHYHPERESTDICAICGKPICKECGLEIAGKIYCKDCLQKIVGIGLENNAEPAEQPVAEQPPIEQAPAEQPVAEQPPVEQAPVENIYATQEEVIYTSEEPITQEYQKISEDSPYNIKENINYSGGLESSYLYENEKPQAPVQNEAKYYAEEPVKAPQEEEFIYPDHSFEPQTTSARADLEDKYEKYLDDLYFDENEVPLNEQLAKDEEQYGSLTRKPYTPSETPAQDQKLVKSRPETPDEMEARIRAEIMKEQGVEPKMDMAIENKEIGKNGDNIHNLNYKEEKEPMNAVDILLTIVLVIVILIVIYYLIYLFVLHSSYPTFMDAVFGLSNPQNVINNALSSH